MNDMKWNGLEWNENENEKENKMNEMNGWHGME